MKTMEEEYKKKTGIQCDAFITKPEQGARVMSAEEVGEGAQECCVTKVVKKPMFWFVVGMVMASGAYLIMRRRH